MPTLTPSPKPDSPGIIPRARLASANRETLAEALAALSGRLHRVLREPDERMVRRAGGRIADDLLRLSRAIARQPEEGA